MLVDRNVARFTVLSDESLLAALQRISDNQSGTIFCIGTDGVVEGVLTDGDFRRWIVSADAIDLNKPVALTMNRDFVWASDGTARSELELMLSDRIAHLPLLDARRRLVAVASRRSTGVQIGSYTVDATSPALTIAEIGINHNGRLDLALSLIDRAAEAGADCAKFQMRHLASTYRNSDALGRGEDLGAQYTLDLLARFALTPDEMFQAFDHCREVDLVPLCTPWDEESVAALESYGLSGYKVASADLTNHGLLERLAETGRPLLISTGMSIEAEIIESTTLLRRLGAAFVLMHCNSTYPAPFKDVNLRYMDRLATIGGGPVGYSGHERGYHVAVAAVACGAKVVEKHFTLDRSMEGSDHKVSLLPDEFRQMVDAIRQVEESLGSADARRLTQGELMNRATLAKSVVATRDLAAGEAITADALDVKSPGRGLQPNQRHHLVGRLTKRDLKAGDFFYPSDLDDESIAPRHYQFRRPWGLPVRHHDYRRLASRSNPDFLEFHLSYRDLDLAVADYFSEPLDLGLVVHSPDLFPGDHILDLAADSIVYRERSIRELQRVVDLTRSMTEYFRNDQRPVIVVSMGGFSKDTPFPETSRAERYARIADSLGAIDQDAVEIVAQTLPPFPWYMGGQLHCNLFVDAEDTARFATEYGYGLCLDVSHTKLATNFRASSLKEAVDMLAPITRHLHLVDARGTDDEGLQIGDGEIDFASLAEQLDQLAPNVPFIPEIWQGHKNDGEEFWLALERLERWF